MWNLVQNIFFTKNKLSTAVLLYILVKKKSTCAVDIKPQFRYQYHLVILQKNMVAERSFSENSEIHASACSTRLVMLDLSSRFQR